MSSEGQKTPPTEKNLPAAQPELPKQKFLIVIFSAIAILAIVGGAFYQWSSHGDNFAETKGRVLKAFEDKNIEELNQLAAKEFLVGQPESENGVIVSPAKIMSKILQLAQTSKWSNKYDDLENIRILHPENGSFQLMFLKTGNTWVWSGFLTVNQEDLATLLADAPVTEKIEYKDIPADENAEAEPTITD